MAGHPTSVTSEMQKHVTCQLHGIYPRSNVNSMALSDGRRPALSRKSKLRVTFTPMSELRDSMVPLLPKQNRQIEEEPRKIPLRSRGKRACGASACLAESSGA
jgi:hypothetical protein